MKGYVHRQGATNSTLFFSSVQPTNAGAYTALVTNLAGTATGRVCQLSVAAGWVFTNAQGTQLPYRLFLPPKYDPATNYPLVLFWHCPCIHPTQSLKCLLV